MKKRVKSIGKLGAKKGASRVTKRGSVYRRGRQLAREPHVTRTPREWQAGHIVLGNPPAKALKGRGAMRFLATEIRDARNRAIPRNVCEWFVRKLAPSHKVSVRQEEYFDAPKAPYLSPEAARLLRDHAAAWAKLAALERETARVREQASLNSLALIEAPKEFQHGKVVLAKPKRPVGQAYCWKPDFEGEIYPAVLHYYSYLPAQHVGSIRAPSGYAAKVMSPEAAQLYRQHRNFWEAKYAELKSASKASAAARKKAAEAVIGKAATSARLSRAELDAKLDRLAMLVEKDNLQLVADMIEGFGEPWLYEALLAGASIEPDGVLKPGKTLKRFKSRAEFVLVLALAAMPDGLPLDPSLRREVTMNIEVGPDTVDIVAELMPRLPNLKVRMSDRRDFSTAHDIQHLRLQTASFLAARVDGGLKLSVAKLGIPEAAALAKIKGALSLDLRALSEEIAARLALHKGDLAFPCLRSISPATAVALRKHVGTLEIGEIGDELKVDAVVARHLAQHAGAVCLPGVMRLDPDVALALAAQRHGLELPMIEEFPDGKSGVKLCERLGARLASDLTFYQLKSLNAECAAALAAFRGNLCVSVRTWRDDALIAIAKHSGKLEIDPVRISDGVGAALAHRGTSTELTIAELLPKGCPDRRKTIISDGAADALRTYRGKLVLAGELEMSPVAAGHLTALKSFVIFRSKLKPSIRKVFESAGTWKDGIWFRSR
jgi:hypothetical protein